ncbi:hypothetical protein KL918_003338 [Ogataea parapolymorpha]|nr:hypothetical protein KL918_003338 [Ogataea parapolymorpha]KAG7872623.1 hypothetical protein KL916_003018 [Ogataea parapolymorpha]
MEVRTLGNGAAKQTSQELFQLCNGGSESRYHDDSSQLTTDLLKIKTHPGPPVWKSLAQPDHTKTSATTMADKFPELEGIDGTDVADSGDFLKREKELLGNEFATEQDKIAEDDDDFDDFKSQFPEVSTNANDVAPEVESEEEPKEAIFEEPVTNKFANLNLEESVHIQEWRKARELEIAKRDELAAKKLEDIKKEAEKAIDDFYENYNNKKDEAVEATRREEAEFLEKRDRFLERGTVWDRVVELLSLTKNSNASDLAGYRDKSKFRDLLMSLKGKEDVPGAAGY